MESLSGRDSDSEAAYRVPGFGGLFLGYRLRPASRVAPFLGVSGLESFPTVESPCFSVNPECGVSAFLGGPYEISLCGRYYFTTQGRYDDFWSVGVGVSRHFR